jgi:hypothetical protein
LKKKKKEKTSFSRNMIYLSSLFSSSYLYDTPVFKQDDVVVVVVVVREAKDDEKKSYEISTDE